MDTADAPECPSSAPLTTRHLPLPSIRFAPALGAWRLALGWDGTCRCRAKRQAPSAKRYRMCHILRMFGRLRLALKRRQQTEIDRNHPAPRCVIILEGSHSVREEQKGMRLPAVTEAQRVSRDYIRDRRG